MKHNPKRKATPRRYGRDVDLADHYNVSRNTIWRWVKLGRLPKPIKLSPGCSRFDWEVIEAHDARLASEDRGAAA